MARIHSTAIVDPGAELGENVEIGPYCVIGPHVKIGAGARLMAHVFMDGWTTLGAGCTVFPFASLGTQTQDLKYKGGVSRVEIGERTTIREYVTVNAATADGDVTRVGSHCHIMAYAHIAHDCRVGDEVIMANCATLAGHILVEDQALIGGLCGVHQFVRIGRLSIIGGCSKVTQDVPPFMMADGHPLGIHGLNSVGLKRRGVGEEAQRLLKNAYRVLYREGLSTSQALERLESETGQAPEIHELVEFVRHSNRGIVR
ncbi:MAG: acyl-ACP--UDP-N-acetylglucosamine O-acyltransferase [Verrucomicrobia bacterium]|nr:acyl-ACP--UDP-N-acetylglucosamine O-acyltransferase [Verrucomicrobiota bacterium]MBU1908423.1 acyl-ACP--UDP-N-acetylglucosamine O-acyltransferase [Verrucomicrobiota bacterium]